MAAAGVEVKELARKTGIAPSTLYAYRNGTRSAPGRTRIDLLADELRVDSDMRARMYTAAGLDSSTDYAEVAADLIRGLPTMRDKELAVELLRAHARVVAPTRRASKAEAQERAKQEAEVDAEGIRTIRGLGDL